MTKDKGGVYVIRNTKNNKRYIGSSMVCVEARMAGHRKLLGDGKHRNRHLQAAWNKYGEDNFVFVALVRCPPDKCLSVEQSFMDKFKSAKEKFGYNISPTAGNTKGVVVTEETKKKLSKSIKDSHADPRVKEKHSKRRADPEFQER